MTEDNEDSGVHWSRADWLAAKERPASGLIPGLGGYSAEASASLRGPRRVAAWPTVALVAAGGALQMYVLIDHAARAHYSSKMPVVDFLAQARAVMPQSAVFANTPTAAEKLRYSLFPRRQYHVVLSGNPDVVRAELARRKVSYAVTNRNDPTIFLPDTGPWWHVVLTHGKWRVIALSP